MAAATGERVGDSSRNVLEIVKRAARALLSAAVEEKKKSFTPDRELSSLRDLMSERRKLHLEKIQLRAEMNLRQSLSVDPLKEESLSSEALREHIDELEDELLTVKLKHSQENQLYDCFHQHDYMVQQLFPVKDGSNPTETSVQKIAKHQSELVSELLYKSAEVEKLNMELSMVRRDRASAQCDCRELMARLDKLMEDDGEAAWSKEMEASADSKSQLLLHIGKDQVTLLRHTLLSLITISGVDWSQDQHLYELVQKLGDHMRWT